jgi:sugar lactone lactonase YvrE
MPPAPRQALALAVPLVLGLVCAGASLSARQGRDRLPAPRIGDPASRRQWPAAPEPTRIRFIRALDPLAVKGRPSLLGKIWRLIVGPSDAPHMSQPYGIAVGNGGKVYVADTFGGAIHVYDLEKPAYSTIRVDGQSLIGVALGASRVFVTDSASGRLLSLDLKGHLLWSRGPKDGLLRPTGLVAGSDRLYVVDTLASRIVMVDFDGRIIGQFGERGSGPGQFNFPTNIARSADGRLYVTDTMNFRIQIFDAEGGFLNTFGRLGDGSGDFDKPKGVAVDSAGHVYVVEGMNDVVQIFDESGKLLLVFGESGRGEGQFWLPSGITIANDVVYVADSANRRVEMFEYVKP